MDSEIAEKYQIVVHQENGEYFGRSLEFPHAMNDGKTRDEAIGNTIDIITTAIATMLELEQAPPTPAL